MPGGRLILTFASQSWKDTRKRQLEDRIGTVAAAIEAVIAHKQEMRQQKLDAIRAEAEHLAEKQWDEEMAKDLLDKGERWEQVQRLRRFVAAVELASSEEPGRPEWVAWAKEFLDARDPLTNRDEQWLGCQPTEEAIEETFRELVHQAAWRL